MPTMLYLPVAAPRPPPRPWATALTTYAELVGPGWDVDSKGVMRWLNGVAFVPFGCEKVLGVIVDPCVQRDSAEAQDGMGEEVTFDPFLMEVSITCSALSVTAEDLLEYVTAHTEVARSSLLGAQVMQGTYTTDNPSLVSEAQSIAGGGTVTTSLALVEDALADLLDGGAGMIHATPGVFSRMQIEGGLLFRDGVWFTATGHQVVADAGYVGPNPADGVVTADTPWLYGSGPVFYKLYPYLTILGEPWENFDYTRDNFLVDVEQYGIAIFEPCSVVAAMVDPDAVTKFYSVAITADLDADHPKTLTYLTVPAGQMWRTQYYAVERVTGSEQMTLSSQLCPAGATGEYLVNQLTFSGENFRRTAGGGVFGPGDKIRISAEAQGPMSVKMIIAIAIEEAVTVHVPPPPGPILSWIDPNSVPRNSKPNFTLGGNGFTLIQSAIEVQIRRPNAVTQSRTGTFVNDTTITFSYDNITLAGQYDVNVKGGAYTSNTVPFTAVETL